MFFYKNIYKFNDTPKFDHFAKDPKHHIIKGNLGKVLDPVCFFSFLLSLVFFFFFFNLVFYYYTFRKIPL